MNYEVLGRCSLFVGIAEASLSHLLRCLDGRVRRYRKKETVLAEGEPLSQVAILLSGQVELSLVDIFGNRSILSVLTPSEMIGEEFACSRVESLPVSAVATEESEVLFLDSDRILHTCHAGCEFHHKMIYNLMHSLAATALGYHRRLEITSRKTTREKLLAYLSSLTSETHARTVLVPFDRQGLADYLGVDRSGLSSEIGKLTREGILKCKKNRFELCCKEDSATPPPCACSYIPWG